MENFVIVHSVTGDAARALQENRSSYKQIYEEPPVTLVTLVDPLYHGQVDRENDGPVFYELNRETGQGVAFWYGEDPLSRVLYAWDKDKDKLKEWAPRDAAFLFDPDNAGFI